MKYADYISHTAKPPAAYVVLGKEGTKPRTMQGRMGTPLNEGSKHFNNFPRDVLIGTTVIRANFRPKRCISALHLAFL
jgi:hypothetical protein